MIVYILVICLMDNTHKTYKTSSLFLIKKCSNDVFFEKEVWFTYVHIRDIESATDCYKIKVKVLNL